MRFHILLAGGCLILLIIVLQYYVLRHFAALAAAHQHTISERTLWVSAVLITLLTLLCMASGSLLPNHPVIQKIGLCVGAICLGFMTTCLMLFLLCDILRLLLQIQALAQIQEAWAKLYHHGLPVLCASALITGLGIWNSARLHLTECTVTMEQFNGAPLQLVLLSDMHEGSALRTDHLERIVAKTNALQPDCILLCGDLFDENTTISQCTEAYTTLAKLSAPFGVYFVFGNHERNLKTDGTMAQALTEAGITVLEDAVVTIDGRLTIAGRKDDTEPREALSTLLADIDDTLPLILLDHQPKDTQNAAELGVDLQLSGHTHGGQIFPGGFLSDLVNEATYGLHTQDDYHLIVSSGCSVWGVPYRTERTSEIVSITLCGT